MSGLVLSIAERQPREVQCRAVAAVNLQRQRVREHVQNVKREGVVVDVERREGYASLDAWYRAQPVKKGRLGPNLRLSSAEKVLYGLSASARLMEIRNWGHEVDHWSIAVFPILHGYVVGVQAPFAGGGVGVTWRRSWRASDYALRLSVEHGFPIQERYV